jgi:hypothetical protein
VWAQARNNQRIPRPDRRQHAGAGDADPRHAARPQGVGNKLASGAVASLRAARSESHRYEVWRLKWHELCVDWTLPQVSALVSKIFSCRNDGFW